MDAITLLKADHKTVEKLFKQYEKLGDKAAATKAQVVEGIIKELAVHAVIEEEVFYPAARGEVPDTSREVLESLEEHHIVKWLLSELEDMEPSHERFDAKVTVLIELVRHHVEEEEGELFPQVRAALGRKRLGEIGDMLATAKKTAPTRPHPRAPDTPPGNVLVGLPTAIVDRVADAGVRAVRTVAKR
jgi:hemerythrin superfamily protein